MYMAIREQVMLCNNRILPLPLQQTYMETAEVFSEVHVERLTLFSIIWSYGGVLVGEKETKRFSHLLKTLTNILPDDDSEFSVFDYYVDESGEWDVWQSRYHITYCACIVVHVDVASYSCMLHLANYFPSGCPSVPVLKWT